MRIRPDERQIIADICREESEEANRRIANRLTAFECRPVSGNDDTLDSIRRFYEELTDSAWTRADEEALKSLGEKSGQTAARRQNFCSDRDAALDDA